MSVQETGQPLPAKQGLFYGYVILWSTFLVMMVAWGMFYTYGVFFQPMATEFNWTRAMTAGAFSLSTVLRGFFSIGVGRLSDRLSPRLITTGCGIFLGLAYLLLSRLNAPWQLYLFYGVILAIGMSASFVPLLSMVAKWFAMRRGVMTGFVMMGVGIGITVMPPVARWLIASYGWRTAYMIGGIACLVVVTAGGQFLRREDTEANHSSNGSNKTNNPGTAQSTSITPKRAMRTRQLWLLCAMYFCFMFISSTVMVHIAPHAMDLQISAAGAANILAAIGAVSLLGRLGLGFVADRAGSKSAVGIGFFLLAVALVYLPVAKETWMFYLFAIAYGLGHGALFTLFSPMVAELFGMRSHGLIFGIITFAGSIGGAIGPVLAGYMFDTANSYQLSFLVSAVLSGIGLILTLLVKPLAVKDTVSV